ncbi:MAG: YccF domain-containing protein [Clostridia bacterium]|nr:YccF domain-containing protein [Clostridia bacterium]
MRTIGNIIWFLLGGLITGLAWFLVGLVLCITVVGIPFGIQCFKFAKISFTPFGKKVHTEFEEHPIMNIIWLILFGWEFALTYLACGVLCCITIVGIPFGLQAFKLMKLAVFPFGADLID